MTTRRANAAPTVRAGYMMAEMTLAFAIFGVAMAGLFPFVLAQLKLTRKLETRMQGTVLYYLDTAHVNSIQVLPNDMYPPQIYHVVPWKNPRMRSLVGGALITTDPLNSIDDYTPTDAGSSTRTPATIYDHRIAFPDPNGDPVITVDLNVESS
jgi:hypothetical protein